jgi:hypothetical protein
VSWLTQPVLVLGGGWSLTAPVLAWLLISALACARFAPQARRAWMAWRRHRAARTNGGTVATAAAEQVVGYGGALTVCLLCLAAAMLAAHRERTAVLPIAAIPLVQLARAEVSARVHAALMSRLAQRGY